MSSAVTGLNGAKKSAANDLPDAGSAACAIAGGDSIMQAAESRRQAVGGAAMRAADHQLGVVHRAQLIRDGLDSIGRRYGVFAPSRGLGLLIGAPMSEAWIGRAKDIVNAAMANGVWTLVAGPDVLRLAPSLVISEAEIAEGLRRLEAGIAELLGASKAAAA